jgi:hypothetical protein
MKVLTFAEYGHLVTYTLDQDGWLVTCHAMNVYNLKLNNAETIFNLNLERHPHTRLNESERAQLEALKVIQDEAAKAIQDEALKIKRVQIEAELSDVTERLNKLRALGFRGTIIYADLELCRDRLRDKLNML